MNAHDPHLARQVPANVEAEQALLGAILVNNRAYDRVSGFLESEHFNEKLHRTIYGVMGVLVAKGQGFSPITIKSYLPEGIEIAKDMTLAQYLVRLAAESVSVINARDYGLAIHEMWIRRTAILALEDAASLAYDLPADMDILAEIGPVEDRLAALRAERVRGENRAGLGKRYLDAMNAAHQRREVPGVPICLPEIARVISEPTFEAGNLYGLLSSSGEGKTSLTLQIISYALEKGHPVQFLSFDQSGDQIMRQMAAQRYGIEARRQRWGDLSEREWETAVDFAQWADAAPFDVTKCTDQGAAQLVGFARTFLKRKANGKVPLIVVDHIRAVKPEDRRADEGTKANDISKVFKAGAETTGAAWLVLNQRNSGGLSRANPRPVAADLFGGEGARTAYDAIFYIYRMLKHYEDKMRIAAVREMKDIERAFPTAVRVDGIDIAEIGAIKVRFGPTNITERLIFEARFTKYRPEHPESELLQQDMGL